MLSFIKAVISIVNIKIGVDRVIVVLVNILVYLHVVSVDLLLLTHGPHFILELTDLAHTKVLSALVEVISVFLLVSDDKENILVAHFGKLIQLLDDTFPALAKSN